MKYINRIIILLLLITTAVSCNDDDSGPGFNQNIEAAGLVEIGPLGSSSETFTIGLPDTPTSISTDAFFNGSLNSADLTIGYQVVTNSGVDASQILQSTSGSVVILAGEFSANITIPLLDNPTIGNSQFDIVLTSLSGNDQVQLGLPDGSRNLTHAVTVCANAPASSYSGMSTSDLGAGGGTDFPIFTPVLTETSPNVFDIDTAWGPDYIATIFGDQFSGQFVYPTTLTINPETSEVTLSSDGGFFTGGTGSIDPCTNIITYTLTQAVYTVGGVSDTVSVVLTPQ